MDALDSMIERNGEDLWQKTLQLLYDSQSLGKDSMTWLGKTQLFRIEDGQALVCCRSIVSQDLIRRNRQLFTDTLSSLYGQPLQIQLINQKQMEELMPREAMRKKTNTLLARRFDGAYTFDSFVKGPSNQEALAACMSVCSRSSFGFNLNPLLIYGNSGLGKTHLLNAVGNWLKEHRPDKRVIYMYSGDLVSLMLEAMRSKSSGGNEVERVKEQLLDCDYFLIDDIQNLRSASCQEVFFTVYNQLISQNKQIILTSDTHPSELSSITKRLISRFSQGLTVNISRPGAETAKAILKKKIDGHEDIFPIDDEVLDFLAVSYSNDIRSLEGSLNRLIFNATLFNPPTISIEFAMGVLKDDPVLSETTQVDAKAIKKAVTRFYGLAYKDLEGKSRMKKIAQARQICIYLMREILHLPYAAIGDELGGRDHTTISSANSKAKKMAATNADYADAIAAIRKKIGV